MGFTGIGVAKTFIHVDTRNSQPVVGYQLMLYTKHTNVTGTSEVVLLTVPTGFVAHVAIFGGKFMPHQITALCTSMTAQMSCTY